MKICPNCSTVFDDKPKFCSQCGARLPEEPQKSVLITEEGLRESSAPEPAASSEAPAEPVAEPILQLAADSSGETPSLPAEHPPFSIRRGEELHSEEYVRQSRKSVWKFVTLIAIASALVLSFVWGLSFLHNLREKAVTRVKDSVCVMESDNDEIIGVSHSGRQVKLKTDSHIAAAQDKSLFQKSADGSKLVFLDSAKVLRLFDGTRFTTVAEEVQEYRISFDGSGVAYTNTDNDLFLYRKGKAQRVAARVAEGCFCLSPDGETLAYVREEGGAYLACFFNSKERTIAKDAVPFAISNGGSYVYYCTTLSKGVVYVQKGGNQDSRQKLLDIFPVAYCCNENGEQILLTDGSNTYFSEYGGERIKIASVPLQLVAPDNLARSQEMIYGVRNLKDRFYITSSNPEGNHIYHLNTRLELSSLLKNIPVWSLMQDEETLLYEKNQNLYYINLRNIDKGESKVAGHVKGWRHSGDGKRVLFVDDEGESWFTTLGREPKRITAETINTEEVIPLEGGFVYEIGGSLFYTNGGKGSKISGLSDEVLSLGGDGFLVVVECLNGDVFISTNGKKYTKYIRK